MRFTVALFSLIFSIANGQKTTNGVCSIEPDQENDNCEIHNLKQVIQFQAMELQVMRNEINILKTKDCSDILNRGISTSGVYEIYQQEITPVYCDMETDGGGWTVIHNRQNGDVDFDRTWSEYKNGFGNVSGNHWLGNKYLHSLSLQRDYELRVDLCDWEDEKRHAIYTHFRVGSEFQTCTIFLFIHSYIRRH